MSEPPVDEPGPRDHTCPQRATSFGPVAAAYDALRPDWPAPTAAWLVGGPGSGRRLRVLDLGTGTGKLAAALARLGHDVVAVDPDAQMLAQAERSFAAAGLTVRTRLGSAEAVPAEDGEVDAVTVAQAWHWFDPQVAGAECARVLRPGGVLGVAWHRRDESVPWVRELSEVAGRMADVAGGEPVHPPELTDAFGPLERAEFGYELPIDPAGLRDLADTWSYVRLSPRRAAVLRAVEALGRANVRGDGTLVLAHRTFCFRAEVAGAAPPGRRAPGAPGTM